MRYIAPNRPLVIACWSRIRPMGCRYRITSAGRLIDSAGNDLEPDGYIMFYTLDRENGDNEAQGKTSRLREYRARFLSGQLQNIVRVDEDGADRVRYGLASNDTG